MDSCFKTSDNKHLQCPPRMADGRHFTDYRSSYYINDLIRADNNISNSLQYRTFLQQNGNALMDRQRQIACNLNCCGPCPIGNKESFQDSTMLPEQYMFVTDGTRAKMVLNNPNGLGVGRQHYTYPQEQEACSQLPSAWPTNQKTNNCQAPLDRLNYLGDDHSQIQGLRQAIPGGGAMLDS
uniref:Uncharacterized protein n=1 Tax=viral metagenome TaxID=1070528 RepID=A0A6C0HLL3_9ZZZZ